MSYPGETEALRNRVEIAVSGTGTVHFSLTLVVRSAWVTDDDTVTCESVWNLFATIMPRPTATLQSDDPTFESKPFTLSTSQTDFTGPKCAEFPYDGSNDETLSNAAIVGLFDGREVRGEATFEDEEGRIGLEFEASFVGRTPRP